MTPQIRNALIVIALVGAAVGGYFFSNRGAAMPESNKADSPVAIDVNGMTVSVAQYEDLLDREIKMALAQMGGLNMALDSTSPIINALKGQFESRLRDRLVQQLAVRAAARDAGIVASADSVQAVWRMATAQLPDDTAVTMALQQANVTREEMLDEIRDNITTEIFLKSRVSPVAASESEARAFFEENKAMFAGAASARARHILIADDTNALKRVREIRARIEKGEDFALLAAQFSIDGSAREGGDLGRFESGRMVPAFDKAVFSLPIGKVSQPVKTQFGWHLIRVDERTPARDANYNADHDTIVRLAGDRVTMEKIQAFVADLQSRATVKMLLPAIAAPAMPEMSAMPSADGMPPGHP